MLMGFMGWEQTQVWCKFGAKKFWITCTQGILGRVSINTFNQHLIGTRLTLDRLSIECWLNEYHLRCWLRVSIQLIPLINTSDDISIDTQRQMPLVHMIWSLYRKNSLCFCWTLPLDLCTQTEGLEIWNRKQILLSNQKGIVCCPVTQTKFY